jgi:predicted dehydrogenase
VLSLGHNRRFLPSVLELKSRLKAGKLGTILHVEANHSGNSGLRFQPGNWRADRKESPAGGMGAMGIHMVDMLINLCGPITEVHAISIRRAIKLDVDDTTTMLFRFKNGMTGYLATLAATTPTQRIEVFGTQGSVEIRNELSFTTGRPVPARHTDYPLHEERPEPAAPRSRGKALIRCRPRTPSAASPPRGDREVGDGQTVAVNSRASARQI